MRARRWENVYLSGWTNITFSHEHSNPCLCLMKVCPHNLWHTWLPMRRVCAHTGRVGQRSEVTYRCIVTIDCGLMLPKEKLWFSTCVTEAGNPGKQEWGGSCVYGNFFSCLFAFGRWEYRCSLMKLIPPQRQRKYWWFQQKLWTMSLSKTSIRYKMIKCFVSYIYSICNISWTCYLLRR